MRICLSIPNELSPSTKKCLSNYELISIKWKASYVKYARREEPRHSTQLPAYGKKHSDTVFLGSHVSLCPHGTSPSFIITLCQRVRPL